MIIFICGLILLKSYTHINILFSDDKMVNVTKGMKILILRKLKKGFIIENISLFLLGLFFYLNIPRQRLIVWCTVPFCLIRTVYCTGFIFDLTIPRRRLIVWCTVPFCLKRTVCVLCSVLNSLILLLKIWLGTSNGTKFTVSCLGVLVECDPAMKQFLLHLDETLKLGSRFIIQV